MGKQKTKQSDDSWKSHPSFGLQKLSPPPHHQVEIRLDLLRWPEAHISLGTHTGHQNTSTLSVITMIHDTWSADDRRHYQQIKENQDILEKTWVITFIQYKINKFYLISWKTILRWGNKKLATFKGYSKENLKMNFLCITLSLALFISHVTEGSLQSSMTGN